MAFVFSHPQPASLIITTVDQTGNGAAYLAVPDHDTQARGGGDTDETELESP